MSDLTERLRDRYSKHSQELRDEAADEIERLTDELINLELVAKDRYCEMQTQIERLEDQLSFMTKECKWFEVRYRRMNQEDE